MYAKRKVNGIVTLYCHCKPIFERINIMNDYFTEETATDKLVKSIVKAIICIGLVLLPIVVGLAL